MSGEYAPLGDWEPQCQYDSIEGEMYCRKCIGKCTEITLANPGKLYAFCFAYGLGIGTGAILTVIAALIWQAGR